MHSSHLLFLVRPDGRLGYDDRGQGPLIVCLPGMGDLRETFRFQLAPLVEAGSRVVTMDLRGHGDSDTTFAAYDDEAAASDLIALITELGQPAIVVGNSMGAAAAVLAACERPDLIDGVVLIGPFVRNSQLSNITMLGFRAMMARPWARRVWGAYLPKLYAGRKPADFEEYRKAVSEAMARDGYTATFVTTTRNSHAAAEAALPHVRVPSLVLMGTLDPDFPDPRAEAAWIVETIGGRSRAMLIDDAGHYPQSQQPDAVNAELIRFIGEVHADA